MKRFEDLEMKQHPNWNGVQARMDFDNDYGVSVINADGSYGYPDKWELAVMYQGSLCYNTYITDDVLGHLSEEEVTEIMIKVQKL